MQEKPDSDNDLATALAERYFGSGLRLSVKERNVKIENKAFELVQIGDCYGATMLLVATTHIGHSGQ